MVMLAQYEAAVQKGEPLDIFILLFGFFLEWKGEI